MNEDKVHSSRGTLNQTNYSVSTHLPNWYWPATWTVCLFCTFELPFLQHNFTKNKALKANLSSLSWAWQSKDYKGNLDFTFHPWGEAERRLDDEHRMMQAVLSSRPRTSHRMVARFMKLAETRRRVPESDHHHRRCRSPPPHHSHPEECAPDHTEFMS